MNVADRLVDLIDGNPASLVNVGDLSANTVFRIVYAAVQSKNLFLGIKRLLRGGRWERLRL